MASFSSKSLKDTNSIATKIARKLKPGDVLALKGELGSGKTTFVQALAKTLGAKDQITSPTFVIAKEYAITKPQTSNFKPQKFGKKHLFLIHIDCYRIKGAEEAEEIGIQEYLSRNDVILAIEWPERVSEILPNHTIKINFENLGQNNRKISIK